MNERIVLTDEQLVRALTNRMRHAPSQQLLDRIVAEAASTAQVRPARRPGWLPWPTGPWAVPVFAGALAITIALALIVAGIRPVLGPGGTPTPPPASPVSSAAPSPRATATVAPGTPENVLIGDVQAQRLHLGTDVAPIDVIGAFDSIWIAGIHANQVRRYDSVTMTELARIFVPSPAWFAVADGALWVASTTATSVSRIDAGSDAVVARVGNVPPCGAPVVAFGNVWQSACDANVYLRIDPATSAVIKTIPAQDHRWLAFAADRLVTIGPEGLAILDPDTGSLTPVGGSPVSGSGQLLGADGETVWVLAGPAVSRIDPTDGSTVATFPYPAAKAVTFADGHAWLSVERVGVLRIDLATNAVVRTIPLSSPDIAREVGGVLWVTDFESSDLWRIEP